MTVVRALRRELADLRPFARLLDVRRLAVVRLLLRLLPLPLLRLFPLRLLPPPLRLLPPPLRLLPPPLRLLPLRLLPLPLPLRLFPLRAALLRVVLRLVLGRVVASAPPPLLVVAISTPISFR